MERHAQIHDEKTQYNCDPCGKSFKSKSNLTSHEKNLHSGLPKSHRCDICDKSFSDKSTLIKHGKLELLPAFRDIIFF